MTNVVPLKRDGGSTIPLCKNCESFRESMGIGSPAYCVSTKRQGEFDPVYGWQHVSVRAHDARRDAKDCGLGAKFYEEKEYLGSMMDDTDLPPKPSLWKRLLTYIKR